MFRTDKEKLKKILDGIAQETGKKRMKFLQRLKRMMTDETELPNEAPRVLFSVMNEPDEEIWQEALGIITEIADNKPTSLKGGLGALVPHLKIPGSTRKRTLMILRTLAMKKRSLVKDFKPILMNELTSGDTDEQELILEVLRKIGINAREYVKRLISIEKVLKDSKNSGADISVAEKVLEEAKGFMIQRGINDFLMRAKKAELMARYAKKVAVKWRDFIKDINSISISSGGHFIAVGTSNEVLMYSHTKDIKWRMSVEGRISVLKFTPDDRALLIGTENRMVYLVNVRGNIIWKRRKSGNLNDASITEQTKEIFICSDDSNISIHTMDGQETSRQWTEKPAQRIDVTADGSILILTYGDHNILSYDNNLFQQWKYMGGIWADIAISSDGAMILGGSQGGDGVCLSKSGLPIWKKSFGEPVINTLLRPDTDCFLFGTENGLNCFDKSGKHLWTYHTREPLLMFDASKDGEIIVLGTKKAIYLIENREVFKHFLYELGSSLKTMETFGIDIAGLKNLIEKANSSFGGNDYKKGAVFVNKIKDLMEQAKLDRGSELLVLAERKLSTARDRGVDVSECEGILHRAEELINRGDFDAAISEAKYAVDLARRAENAKKRTEIAKTEKRREDIRKILDVAISMIDEAEAMGIDTTEAENLLQASITASDEGEFDQCIFIVKELDEHLQGQKKMVPSKTEATFAMAVGIIDIEDARTGDLKNAIGSLTRGVKYYESIQNMKRVAECYEVLAKLEAKNNNHLLMKAHYQRAINTYFKIGELEKVAKIIMDLMKDLKGYEETPIFEVEDAFLIFTDGRLITHHTTRLRADIDRQILGGMLVAIQNFVEDSLQGSEADMLNELRYGNTKIIIQRGNFITIALVIKGSESKEVWQRIKQTIAEIEEKYGKRLEKWDGDLDKLWGVKKVFEQFISQL